jgi:hypothetical protein
MALALKKITLWRTEVENKPGMLAQTLEPLAAAGADLHIVMGYRIPGQETRAVIEVYPVTGKRTTAAAQSAGLSEASFPALLVQGDNEPGLGHKLSRAIADAGVNLSFLVAQVLESRYSAVIGLENEEDLRKVSAIVRKVSAPPKKAAPAKKKKK